MFSVYFTDFLYNSTLHKIIQPEDDPQMHSSLDAKKDEIKKNPSIHGKNVKNEPNSVLSILKRSRKLKRQIKSPYQLKILMIFLLMNNSFSYFYV